MREERTAKQNAIWFFHNTVMHPLAEVVAWLVPVFGQVWATKLHKLWVPEHPYEVECKPEVKGCGDKCACKKQKEEDVVKPPVTTQAPAPEVSVS